MSVLDISFLAVGSVICMLMCTSITVSAIKEMPKYSLKQFLLSERSLLNIFAIIAVMLMLEAAFYYAIAYILKFINIIKTVETPVISGWWFIYYPILCELVIIIVSVRYLKKDK